MPDVATRVELVIEDMRLETARLPLEGARAIAREVQTTADIVRVTLLGRGCEGRGEACPMPRYGESQAYVIAQLEAARTALARTGDLAELQGLLPPGAARNALDSAGWDLAAKQAGVPVETLTGQATARPVVTAYTIPLEPPEVAHTIARREAHRPLIKLKLGRPADDRARLEAVRRAAPRARLIVDPNEGWALEDLLALAPVARTLGVEMIEQPLPARADRALAGLQLKVPLCADESCHTRGDLKRLGGLYDVINIKLDKSGGLTEALALAEAAKVRGFRLMIGSTNGTTLGLAPALLAAQTCAWCDLDAPLFLAERESDELAYDGSALFWSPGRRWGLP